MFGRFLVALLSAVLTVCVMCPPAVGLEEAGVTAGPATITLPKPDLNSSVTVEQALRQRRSVRKYSTEPLTLQEVSQLLWAAQGITEPTRGLRTAPSAQATYPLRLYLVAANVKDLPAGIYLYVPQGHKLELVSKGDQRAQIGNQPQMQTAPALLVFAVDYTVTGPKYGKERAESFAGIEAGHAAQNVLLEEVALGLVGVPMGGFDPAKTKAALKLSENQKPLYVVSAGKRPSS